jgi:hypothetical protein
LAEPYGQKLSRQRNPWIFEIYAVSALPFSAYETNGRDRQMLDHQLLFAVHKPGQDRELEMPGLRDGVHHQSCLIGVQKVLCVSAEYWWGQSSENPILAGFCVRLLILPLRCSAFTYVSAYMLAELPKAIRSTRGFDGFVTSSSAPIATGWSNSSSGGNGAH